jgi:hypothetical protein
MDVVSFMSYSYESRSGTVAAMSGGRQVGQILSMPRNTRRLCARAGRYALVRDME